MTFYELIRASLLEDAEKHPYPLKTRVTDPPDSRIKTEKPDQQEAMETIR